MSVATAATEATEATEIIRPVEEAPLDLEAMRLPVWFFGFEAVFASAFDLIKAFPPAWPALVVLLAVNITLSLTMMRRRLRLAKALWRGKGTRKLAIGLVALRLGSHFALGALGVNVTSTAGHVAFALVMGAVTVTLLAFTQHTALRALAGTPAPAPAR